MGTKRQESLHGQGGLGRMTLLRVSPTSPRPHHGVPAIRTPTRMKPVAAGDALVNDFGLPSPNTSYTGCAGQG
jgi:hypothetical protein